MWKIKQWEFSKAHGLLVDGHDHHHCFRHCFCRFRNCEAFLKYGNYQISSDHDRIYITKGLIDETAFSIAKEKVQAIEIKQSFMKRLLGLAEVKLTSAGGLSSGEDTLEINSLYPFLPVKRAYEMVSEILPSYEISQKMSPLPIKSFWGAYCGPAGSGSLQQLSCFISSRLF